MPHKNIYLLYGEEQFQITSEKNKLLKQFMPPENTFGLHSFRAEECSYEKLYQTINTVNPFAAHNVIVCDNPAFIKENENPDQWISFLTNIPKDVVLIISANTVDGRKKFNKWLLKNSNIKEYKKLADWNEKAYQQFIEELFAKEKRHIDFKALNLLWHIVGPDKYLLSQEINKIVLYTPDERITEEQIKAVVSPGKQQLFVLNDALRRKDFAACLQLFEEALAKGQKPLLLLGQIVAEVRLLLTIVSATQDKLSISEIAALCGKRPQFVQFLLSKNKFTEKELRSALILLANLDVDIKTGKKTPAEALRWFFIESLDTIKH